MPSSEAVQPGGVTAGERRARWIALAALLPIVPATMAAVGWRDWAEIERTQQLHATEVPAGSTGEYNGGQVSLAGLDVMPPTPGVPADRAFVRTRVAVQLREPAGQHWQASRQRLVDGRGREWSAIDLVPFRIKRMMAKPGEPIGEFCTILGLPGPKAGDRVLVESFYLVPRDAIPTLAATLSTQGGRPAYLRLATGGAQ